MSYFRLAEHRLGGYTIETDCVAETLLDNGNVKTFIHIPKLEDLPSPFLEDLFHAVNAELTFRDKRLVDESF